MPSSRMTTLASLQTFQHAPKHTHLKELPKTNALGQKQKRKEKGWETAASCLLSSTVLSLSLLD